MRNAVALALILLMAAITLSFANPAPVQAGVDTKCEAKKVIMTFGDDRGEIKKFRLSIKIKKESSLKCAFHSRKVETRKYTATLHFEGRNFVVPERCLANFEVDFDKIYGHADGTGGVVLARGITMSTERIDDRVIYLIRGEVMCLIGCGNSDCEPLH